MWLSDRVELAPARNPVAGSCKSVAREELDLRSIAMWVTMDLPPEVLARVPVGKRSRQSDVGHLTALTGPYLLIPRC